MKTELLLDAKATLGESPAWNAKSQTLYWVDILQKRVYAGAELLAELDDLVGCLAPCKNGHLLLGTRLSFADLDRASGKLTVHATLAEPANTRLNDGKCDPIGRFLAGTQWTSMKKSPAAHFIPLMAG